MTNSENEIGRKLRLINGRIDDLKSIICSLVPNHPLCNGVNQIPVSDTPEEAPAQVIKSEQNRELWSPGIGGFNYERNPLNIKTNYVWEKYNVPTLQQYMKIVCAGWAFAQLAVNAQMKLSGDWSAPLSTMWSKNLGQALKIHQIVDNLSLIPWNPLLLGGTLQGVWQGLANFPLIWKLVMGSAVLADAVDEQSYDPGLEAIDKLDLLDSFRYFDVISNVTESFNYTNIKEWGANALDYIKQPDIIGTEFITDITKFIPGIGPFISVIDVMTDKALLVKAFSDPLVPLVDLVEHLVWDVPDDATIDEIVESETVQKIWSKLNPDDLKGLNATDLKVFLTKFYDSTKEQRHEVGKYISSIALTVKSVNLVSTIVSSPHMLLLPDQKDSEAMLKYARGLASGVVPDVGGFPMVEDYQEFFDYLPEGLEYLGEALIEVIAEIGDAIEDWSKEDWLEFIGTVDAEGELHITDQEEIDKEEVLIPEDSSDIPTPVSVEGVAMPSEKRDRKSVV